MTRLRLVVAAVAVGSVIVPTQATAQWKTDFDKHTVPLDEITSGGPPKDGIPAIDRPEFVSVHDADGWLGDREPVVVVEHGGKAKAYPLQILIWHEIVNDEIAGLPVSVTFCPLCNTALTFDRRFDDEVLDFGTTGMLRHSDLVMYDRQSETWWQQASGEAIVGKHAGRQLTFVSSPIVSWKQFKGEYPEGQVLSRQTGYTRDYGRNPYQRYDTRSAPFSQFFRGRQDGRLPAMERVVALAQGDSSVAYSMSVLEDSPAINDTFGGHPIVVLWAPGTASALDALAIADGREVGSTAVYARELGGRVLSFESAGPGRYRDVETGSTWNIFGRATGGPLAGQRLDPVPHGNHFWFAWAVFMPDTRVES